MEPNKFFYKGIIINIVVGLLFNYGIVASIYYWYRYYQSHVITEQFWTNLEKSDIYTYSFFGYIAIFILTNILLRKKKKKMSVLYYIINIIVFLLFVLLQVYLSFGG
ncbi:MAG: hypothetical protein WCL54_09085, partial [Clostridia bacterium]